MNDRRPYVEPSTVLTAFNCPHCGALAKQYWSSCHAKELENDHTPTYFSPEDAEQFGKEFDKEHPEAAENLRKWARRIASGAPFVEGETSSIYVRPSYNLNVSRCFNCKKISIWLGQSMVYPDVTSAVIPNPDLPEECALDFREAASILDKSPRGAAALLRLCLQNLVKVLGGKGKNLNDDIGTLVKQGLDERIQQSLDVVRVIGNNAVHPGELDLRDNRAVAEKLFHLINIIADVLISRPKEIKAIYEDLPEGARQAIEQRDSRTEQLDS